MILWPSKKQAVRVNVPRTTLSAPIEYDHATTKRVVAKYKETKKVVTLMRDHKDSLKSKSGWTNNPDRMMTFASCKDAQKYMQARKIANARVVLIDQK